MIRFWRRPLPATFAVLVLGGSRVSAQHFERLYDAGWVHDVSAVRACGAGGSVAVGTSSDADPAPAAWMLRAAPDGSSLWERTYRLGERSMARSVLELRDGSGFVVAGQTSPGTPAAHAFLMKLDCDGNTVWTQSYVAPGDAYDDPTDVMEAIVPGLPAAAGDLIVSGVRQAAPGQGHGLLFRTDPSGALRWSYNYDGGNDYEVITAIAEATVAPGGAAPDILAVGYRVRDRYRTFRPWVMRLGADGRLDAAAHCSAEYDVQGRFSSVVELAAPAHAGQLAIAGETWGASEELFIVRTTASPCAPVEQRQLGARGARGAITAVREVLRPRPGTPAGTLALTGWAQPLAWMRADAFLLTVRPDSLAPLTGALFGDHAHRLARGTRETQGRSLAVLPDGFLIGGVRATADLDVDVSLVRTDRHGRTACSLPWRPAHRKSHVSATAIGVGAAPPGLAPGTPGPIMAQQNTARVRCR